MRLDTSLVRFDCAPGDRLRPNSTPIYQTATFEQPNALDFGAYDYTRSGNPTRSVLETQLARLEGAERAFAFASGMAALSTLVRLVPAGGHIVAGDDLYGGTYRLLERVASRCGVLTTYVDASDVECVARAIRPETKLVLVETPTNPLQRVCDLRALSAVCRAHRVLLGVDSSLMSPLLQRPLEHGADVVVHSATKHLCGHGDATAGVLAVRDRELASEIAFLQNAEGNALAPFECWLLLRGLKTLSLRLERAQSNAERVARFLKKQRGVTRVHWPGLDDHPGRGVHFAQASGPGSLVSFETGSFEASRRIVEALECFTISVSFGSTNSLASLPCRMSHKSIPSSVRHANALADDLVRLSIGIEDPRDLVEDLVRAFAKSERDAARLAESTA